LDTGAAFGSTLSFDQTFLKSLNRSAILARLYRSRGF